MLYGDEPWQPYNRVLLSSLLAGGADWANFTDGLALPDGVETRFGCRVTAIDPAAHCVIDAEIQAAVDFMISTINPERNTP